MSNQIPKNPVPKLSENSLEIVKKRYLKQDVTGKIIETVPEMFWRVATFIASADASYPNTEDSQNSILKFYNIMASGKFLPGGRVLFEAGNENTGQLSSCFVVPIKDSMKDIFQSLSNAAVIQQNNGGTGFNFSSIRPKGDVVKNIPNVAAGPIHYIKTFDTALSRILQGSKRHGGNMGILNVTHPDIEDFIDLKLDTSIIKNFNLSIGVNADFMEKVRNDSDYELINPRTNKPTKKLPAKYIFNKITRNAWKCADPGMIFLDYLDADNPTPHLGKMEATNPCGEQPLLPYESCNLGSIIIPSHIENGKINWDNLKKTIQAAVHFMDNMIDKNNYPLDIIKENVHKTRKIGLGIIGFAEALYLLNIPYNSDDAIKVCQQIMKFIRDVGHNQSAKLSLVRGTFPAWDKSIFAREGRKMRNATITTIAPTGTISLVANSSSGVEPVFGLVNIRKTFFEQGSNNEASKTLIFVDHVFEKVAKSRGFYSEKLMKRIAKEGTIAHMKEIPEDVRRVFVTAHDISFDWHVKIQAAAQKYTDNAVSKTINFPYTATVEDVRKAYILAYEQKCKGITIYRDGSKDNQILSFDKEKKEIKPSNKKDNLQIKPSLKKATLSDNALTVLKKRALKRDPKTGNTELPSKMFRRVANVIASADKKYKMYADGTNELEENFYNMLSNLEFLPGQALRNAGDAKLSLSACFVLPIDDSIDGIMKAMSENVIVHKSTCGTGFNFSKLRSKNSTVGSTSELASGPIAFAKAFNATLDTIKTKGGRKQGSMLILNIDHPDIEEFISSKDNPGELSNFNISVGITDKFLTALKNDTDFPLVDPHSKEIIKNVSAKKLFEKITEHAWKTGDPGIMMIDNIETDNPTPAVGKMEATNPCGEQPLLPYETCNLGSIVLPNMLKETPAGLEIDFDKLKQVTKNAVHFLDNTIDVNNFPLQKMKEMAQANRKIGLGVMGFADMLIKLGIPYNSNEAIRKAEKIMEFITETAREYSIQLGKNKGSFPNFSESIWKTKYNLPSLRNAAITTIAPTGYTSIVANCSSGIEPLYALAYKRTNSMGGVDQIEIHEGFKETANKLGFYSDELMDKISKKGSIKDFNEIPQDIRNIYVTSHDITPEWHLKIQAAFQKNTDNAVSKTINFSKESTVEDIRKSYKHAFDLGLKGMTIYRDGSKDEQVLSVGTKDSSKDSNKPEVQTSQNTNKVSPKPRLRPEVTKGFTYEIKTSYGDLYVTINEDEEGNPFEVFATIGKAGGFFAAKSEAICRLVSLSLRSGIPVESIIKQLKGIRGPMPSWSKKGMIFSIPDAIAKILSEHLKKDQIKLPLDYNSKVKQKASSSKKELFPETKEEKEIRTKNETTSKESKTEIPSIKKATLKQEKSSQKNTSNVSDSISISNKSEVAKPISEPVHEEVSIADKGEVPECPDCGNILEFTEGCMTCRACGYSKCG